MESTQLQAYLEQVLTLETQYQTARQAYLVCANKVADLGHPGLLKEPQKPAEEGGGFCSGLLMGIIGFAICAFISLILSSLRNYTGDGWILGILSILSQLLAPLPIFAGFLWLGYCVITGVGLSVEQAEKNKRNKCNYEQALQRYYFQKSQDEERLKNELRILPDLKRNAELLRQRAQKSKEILDQYYSLNVLAPKYRSLICVATFLEYLETERCYKLTGHEGCYNLFEAELRQGIIIAQLTNISQQLEQIRANQERAADALECIQRTCSHLTEGIQNLNEKMDMALENQRVQTYYAEQTAREQRFLNDYVMMRDILWKKHACNV